MSDFDTQNNTQWYKPHLPVNNITPSIREEEFGQIREGLISPPKKTTRRVPYFPQAVVALPVQTPSAPQAVLAEFSKWDWTDIAMKAAPPIVSGLVVAIASTIIVLYLRNADSKSATVATPVIHPHDIIHKTLSDSTGAV